MTATAMMKLRPELQATLELSLKRGWLEIDERPRHTAKRKAEWKAMHETFKAETPLPFVAVLRVFGYSAWLEVSFQHGQFTLPDLYQLTAMVGGSSIVHLSPHATDGETGNMTIYLDEDTHQMDEAKARETAAVAVDFLQDKVI